MGEWDRLGFPQCFYTCYSKYLGPCPHCFSLKRNMFWHCVFANKNTVFALLCNCNCDSSFVVSCDAVVLAVFQFDSINASLYILQRKQCLLTVVLHQIARTFSVALQFYSLCNLPTATTNPQSVFIGLVSNYITIYIIINLLILIYIVILLH